MDTAIEQFKSILATAIQTETVHFQTEINELKEKIKELTVELKEKDRQCRHLVQLLQSKNEEWKQIKSKLLQRRNNVVDKDYETEAAKTDEDVVIEIVNDNSNDCTQLPTTAPDISFTSSSSSALPPADTQSNLDTLISLISETESDSENTQLNDNTNIANTDNMHFKSLADASFTSLDDGRRKRKSHSRGCACCEKYYSATRLSSVMPAADSFLAAPKTPPGFWDTSFTPRQ